MSLIKSVFLFVRWPITLGITLALALIVLFPDQLKVGSIKKAPSPPPQQTQEPQKWNGPVSYAAAVEKASMGVVNIYTRKAVEQRVHPFFNDPIFRHLFNAADTPRQKRMQSALGSGVVMTKEGHIITNYHVVGGADKIVVALEDGRHAEARVLGENRKRDLAVLKIELSDLQPVNISSSIPMVGDVVLAIGNPFGVGQTVTQGIISATQSRNRDLNISDFEDFIQTDATVHPGSSGGALIDVFGNLLGINTANLPHTGSTGIAFAVPVDIAMQTLKDIVQFGRVVRGWLGVEAEKLNPKAAIDAGLPRSAGMVITRTMQGGPAHLAGLRAGDIIVGISGNPIREPEDIIQTIQESRPGDTVTIEYIRGGQISELDVLLQEQPLAG